MNLITHPNTEINIKRFLINPSHGLLITGSEGAGKTYVAKYITSKILSLQESKLTSHPYIKHLQKNDSEVLSIDHIRELKNFLNLKTTGKNSIRRFAIVSDAHELGHEAQNAMLKLLEEPPQDTCIILTSSEPSKLKQTIISRLQTINVHNISKSQINKFANNDEEADKLFALSGGAVSNMLKIKNDNDSQITKYIDQAKDIINSNRLERLSKIDKINKDKEYDFKLLLESLYRIIDFKFKLLTGLEDKSKAKNIYDKMVRIQYSQKMLRCNVQPKLVLTELFYAL